VSGRCHGPDRLSGRGARSAASAMAMRASSSGGSGSGSQTGSGASSRTGSKCSRRRPGADGALSFLTEPLDMPPADVKQAGDFGDAQDGSASERRKGLIEEAEMRAEHQAAARLTMLSLARELEHASKLRRQAEAHLLEERQKVLKLEAANRAYEKALEEADERVQDARVDHCRDKLKVGMREGVFTASVLLWSRQVLPIDRMGEGMSDTERQILDDDGGHDPIRKQLTGRTPEFGKLRSVGDGLMLKWMMRAWLDQVAELKRQRLLDAEHEAQLAALRAEMDKMRESYEKQLAEEKAKVRALEQRIKALQDEIRQLQQRCDHLETARPEPVKREIVVEKADDGRYDELMQKYIELKKQLEIKEAEKVVLVENVRELETKLEVEREQSTLMINNLKGEVRSLGSELQRQIVFAKHLREVALRAKRDAASSVTPEKFAQLITELEDLRDRLSVLGAEHNREREQAKLLNLKLDQNKRRLELERQFLPLLHKVRGPVGPKNPLFQKNMAAMAAAAMVPDELGLTQSGIGAPERLRMAHSQSASAIETLPAAVGGGRGRQDPRMGGGHRLAGGF